MSCKLSDKCDNVFACNILRPNVELLGCNFYKPKNPMTNEEWRKTCSTEEFAEALTKVVLNIVSWNNDPKPSEVRNILKSWLKQPHKGVAE